MYFSFYEKTEVWGYAHGRVTVKQKSWDKSAPADRKACISSLLPYGLPSRLLALVLQTQVGEASRGVSW